MSYETAKEIRHANLLVLISRFSTANEFSHFIDKPQALISQLKNGKGLGNDLAREIEDKLGLESGWMDHRHDEPVSSLESAIETIRNTFTKLELSKEEATLLRDFRTLDEKERKIIVELTRMHRNKI